MDFFIGVVAECVKPDNALAGMSPNDPGFPSGPVALAVGPGTDQERAMPHSSATIKSDKRAGEVELQNSTSSVHFDGAPLP